MLKLLNFKINKSFTIIEMLVVISVFFITVGAVSGIFTTAIKLQRYNLTYQQLLDQTSYAMEYMSRAIRMAQKDKSGNCTGTSNLNYQVENNSIKFLTYHNPSQCWRFYLDDGVKLKVDQNNNSYDLISENFEVNDFRVSVLGDKSGEQPKVEIFMEVKAKGSGNQPTLKIKTTVSQRNLNTD